MWHIPPGHWQSSTVVLYKRKEEMNKSHDYKSVSWNGLFELKKKKSVDNSKYFIMNIEKKKFHSISTQPDPNTTSLKLIPCEDDPKLGITGES